MSRLLFWIFLVSAGLLCLEGSAQEPAAPEAAEVETDDTEKDPEKDSEKDSEKDDLEGGDPSTQSGSAAPEISDEEQAAYEAEVKRRTDVFHEARKKFEEALLQQRATYIRYVNKQDASKPALDRFREQRIQTREEIDQTYLAALDLIRIAGDDEAAQYMATVIENRLKFSFYDASTAEGCARLIDGGAKFVFLFQAGARSAVASGEFNVARKIYNAMSDDLLEDLDRMLISTMDEIEVADKAEQEIRRREAEADELPLVKLETSQGDIVLELYINQAPSTVANFITLVEQGFYDGVDFHQVVGDLLALTGDPTGLGAGNSGKFLVDEHTRPDRRKAFRGSLVMAKFPIPGSGKFLENSASSQFAILYAPQQHPNETVFGHVREGMDVVCRLQRVNDKEEKEDNPFSDNKDTEIKIPPDYIIQATVTRRPETLPEINYFDPSSIRKKLINPPKGNAIEDSEKATATGS